MKSVDNLGRGNRFPFEAGAVYSPPNSKTEMSWLRPEGGVDLFLTPILDHFLGLPSCDSTWHPGPDGYVRIDFARTVWKKNGVNFSSKINVNPVISGLVG